MEGRMFGIAKEGYCNSEKFVEFISPLACDYKGLGYRGILRGFSKNYISSKGFQ